MSSGQPTQHWFPVAGEKSGSTTTRPQGSAYLGMGGAYHTNVQNNFVTWDRYLDAGEWKFATIYWKDSSHGIATLRFNDVDQGTIDQYSASTLNNQYSEITGLSVTAGVKEIKLIGATKNASSTAYYVTVNSIALIRTSGTGGPTTGSDEPGHRVELIPWMGAKSSTGALTRTQASTYLSGGEAYHTTAAVNDEITFDVWFEKGTYRQTMIGRRSGSHGIASVQIDATEVASYDFYNGSEVQNHVFETTGIGVSTAGRKTYTIKASSKNASSSSYFLPISSTTWTRTGGFVRPGYLQSALPWVGSKSNVNWALRSQSSVYFGGGILDTNSSAQNNSVTVPTVLDAGTFKFGRVGVTDSGSGIASIQLEGVTLTTQDWYTASGVNNAYSETTGLVVRRAKRWDFKTIMATKHASSSAYRGNYNSWLWARTG